MGIEKDFEHFRDLGHTYYSYYSEIEKEPDYDTFEARQFLISNEVYEFNQIKRPPSEKFNFKDKTLNAIYEIAHNVRLDFENKYGTGTDLCGHCIEASELISQRISNEIGIPAICKEGWCKFDDESYGSDHPWDPHTWVEVPSLDLYIDVTADQFNFGMYQENEFQPIVIHIGPPQNMQYDEPSWDDFEYYEINLFEEAPKMYQSNSTSLEGYVGKTIMAYEDIFQFSTSEKVSTRGRCIGVVSFIDSEGVHMYDRTNPGKYKNYVIKSDDFERWIEQGLYKAKTATLDERLEALKQAPTTKTLHRDTVQER